MLINEKHLAELNSPVQRINARVELHSGSTLAQICTCNDYLANFTVERVGEGKFFGYGICHKLIAKFIDPDREINLTNIDFMEVTFGVNGEYIYPFPPFYVLEVNRDETTNEISVIAYDTLFQTTNHTVSELILPSSYNMLYFVSACAALLGISVKFENIKDIGAFIIDYPGGANFDGSETLRQALDAVAEATQTIYYLNGEWQLTFRRLDQTGAVVTTIDKEQYLELTSGANCILGAITHTTELGDSITATIVQDGVTQFLRDNPFLELREDAGAILERAISAVGGLTINPFDCSWMGNYLLEIGDKIAFLAENDEAIVTYIVDDSITFDGTLGQHSRWEFIADEAETADNPTSLGEALNKTFARVDKVNKRIDLVASDVNEYGGKITSLELTTDGLNTTVSKVQENVSAIQEEVTTAEENISTLQGTSTTHTEEIGALKVSTNSISLRVQKVEEEMKTFEELETGQFVERVAEIEIALDTISTSVSETETNVSNLDGRVESNASKISALEINADSISASVQKNQKEVKEQLSDLNTEITSTKTELANFKLESNSALLEFQTTVEENGVTKVDTGTGFRFDENGLNISKTDSEINTTITEDGMKVERYGEQVLVANNQGVKAEDLHATTYLIIGSNSRLEDWNERTACFWIGN